ncbi:uncharacterized protein LOC18448254 isoform X2 [Amborella trichopoda]|uniref:uncharacterized protein LOC18448254 isoform X2 n=1 Tax=Amborella trichopoda TaxID=13333 RepID=UPI0009BF8D54|nr:uncharacterized protein LOC18448254 isoform X2 [Amborella trichopoda]|eukprot:XP_020531826.1 uncharacterized protein LOC18448254 isoform X2 [Amborella trichopoda]
MWHGYSGAIMLLFEGDFGSILHTGDCRLTYNCLEYLPLKYITKTGRKSVGCLDYLFLDCTFARYPSRIPSKKAAIEQVISCIWKHPDAPFVYLACDLLGQEEILIEVSKTFGSKIFVDDSINPEFSKILSITAPHILCQDSSSRFQVCEGYSTRLYEKAQVKLIEAKNNMQPEPLFIRPSTQWYACQEGIDNMKQCKQRLKEAERDQFGVWHVCYCMHSSREELELALKRLQPKRVISTTPNFRAMELNYVRKNCSLSSIMDNDPLWKLLDIRADNPTLLSSCALSRSDELTREVVSLEEQDSTLRISTNVDKELKLCNSTMTNSANLVKEGKTSDISMTRATNVDKKLGNYTSIMAKSTNLDDELMTSTSTTTSSTNLSERFSQTYDFTRNHAEEIVDLSSPPLSSRPITLFGKARMGLQESPPRPLQKDTLSVNKNRIPGTVPIDSLQKVPYKEDVTLKENEATADTSNEYLRHEGGIGPRERITNIGASRTLDPSLRKLYRAMNVPVPRPLPSLTELIRVAKQARREYGKR